uniref:CSON008615 protein n=1 Tax=Culicoides sonorensis TaxID=179676 RepID=A0A336LZN6_CULSO
MSDGIVQKREILSCAKCGHVYYSPSQLKIHLETDCGKVKKFVCFCGKKYLTEGSLNQHSLSHNGQKKFLCDFCGKSFLSKGQLTIHERCHTNDKPFGCGICSKKFAYRESLITHASVHSGVKPYECACCKKTFSCIGNLLKHRKTRPDTCGSPEFAEVKKIAPRPMTKNLCIPIIIEKKGKQGKSRRSQRGINLKQEKTVIKNEITNNLDTNFMEIDIKNECDDDNETEIEFFVGSEYQDDSKDQIIIVKDSSFLMSPVIIESDNYSLIQKSNSTKLISQNSIEENFNSYVKIENNTLSCRMCPRIYKSINVFLKHLEKEHQIVIECKEEFIKKCQNTMKSVPNPEIIKKENSKMYSCSKCDRKFSSKTVILDHERSNCGKTPLYDCKVCNKRYHSAGSLKTHMTIHTGELNHICPFCGKTFRTAGQVKIHSRKHTKDQPYQCETCTKRFAYRESLIVHLSIHTGIKRFMCGCGKKFSCISNLKAHRKSRESTCGKLPLDTKPISTTKS